MFEESPMSDVRGPLVHGPRGVGSEQPNYNQMTKDEFQENLYKIRINRKEIQIISDVNLGNIRSV